jgi:PAS domain-containing protein
VSHIGRRILDGTAEAVYVTVWSDPDALTAAGGSPSEPANRDQWERYFAEWSFTSFEALARVAPRRGEGTALLLVDDERRFLFATPAAGRLVGRPPARLLGRRLEDVAAPTVRDGVRRTWEAFLRDGRQSGAFELATADGAVGTVRYEARANFPWPGAHAAVFGPPGAVIDVDDALANAGIIARYELLDPV